MSKGEFRITNDEKIMLRHCVNGGELFNDKPLHLAAPMLKRGWLIDNGRRLVITDLGRTIARQLGLAASVRP